ncbi:MAG TPA: amino acid ABC transporter substrate-binding protein, partial [Methylibium sp.]
MVVLELSASLAQAGPVMDKLRQGGKLVIAHRESSVPFSYVGPDKKPVGYAMDLCLKIAEALRKKLDLKTLPIEYKQVTPSNRIDTIVQHQADMECGSTTNNAERRQKVAFTIPHYVTGARYMVRADSPIDDLSGFEGKKLVSTKGTTPLTAVDRANRERLLRIQILEAPDHSRAVEMVKNGEAEG